MLFIELQGEGDRPALPPPPSTSPRTFLTVKKTNKQTPPPSRLLHVHTHPPAHRESEQTVTDEWSDSLKIDVAGVPPLL